MINKKVALALIILIYPFYIYANNIPEAHLNYKTIMGSVPIKTWKDLRDSNIEKQDEDFSCGSASVATILRSFYGKNVYEKDILCEVIRIGGDGAASFADLEQAVKKFGFKAIGLALSFGKLKSIKIPAIVYLRYRDKDRFSVIRGVNEEGLVWLGDPSWGNRKFTESHFKSMWETRNEDNLKGKILLIIPKDKSTSIQGKDFFGSPQVNHMAVDLLKLRRLKGLSSGYLYVFIAAVLWACIGPVAKIAFAEGMRPLEVGFWRAGFGGLAFAVHGLFTKQLALRPRDLPGIVCFAFFCIAVFFCAYQIAVEKGGAALASVLLYTAPAWVALLARIILGEILTPLRLLSIGLSVLGAGAVAFGADGSGQMTVSVVAVGCGLLAGFTYAMTYIFGKKFLRRYSSVTVFSYAVPFALLFLLPFVSLSIPSVKAFFAVVFLGLGTTYGAYLAYYRALACLDASKVAVVATLEPVLAAVMAFVWWSERFTLFGYLGAGLILVGVLLTILEKNTAKQFS